MPLDDEIYFKVAIDLQNTPSQFQDLSKHWDKHYSEIAKNEKAIRDFSVATDKAYQKVNQKIKENISQVANEGKAMQQLEKYFQSLSKESKKAFDDKDLKKFNEVLNQVSKTLGSGSSFDLELEDLDELKTKIQNAKGEIESTQVLIDFFEKKINNSEVGAYGDKFQKVADNISQTKEELKEAQKYLDLVNQSLTEYQARPITEKKAATEIDLRTQQSDAKDKVDALTVSLALQEKEYEKQITSTSTLATQLRKVKDELVKLELEGGRGSKRWDQLTDAATKYDKAIQDVNQEIKRTSSDTAGLDTLLGAATCIVGVFSAAEGAAALFGDESEELGEVLVKLGGAIALLNGLQAVQAEVTKKTSLAQKVLNFLQSQYTIATNASATATARLGAAMKLTGIGLIIGAIAAAVVYWEDIAKAIGITTEKTERLNEINKAAASSAGDEIGRLKALQLQLTDTNTPLDRQKEIKKELLAQYPGYLKVLGDEEASAEDIAKAFTKLNNALLINAKLKAAQELISTEYKKVLEAERKAVEGEISLLEKAKVFIKNPFDLVGMAEGTVKESQENLEEIKSSYSEFEKFMQGIIQGLNMDLTSLGGDPNKDSEKNKDLENYKKQYENFLSVMEKLINRRKELETSAIENNRTREKAILTNQFEADKLKYQKEIDALEISQEKKLALTKEFNRLYNEESGVAYLEYRKGIAEIDQKFDKEFNAVRLKSLSAINEVFLTSTELERKAIKDKYEVLRKDILDQMKQTEGAIDQQLLSGDLIRINVAEGKETDDYDLKVGNDKLERQREMAKATLEILKSNNKDILNLEKLHQLELLALDETFYKEKLNIIKDSLGDLAKQDIFKELTTQLQNAKFIEEIEAIRLKLIQTFGEETADEIIKIVEALNNVQDKIKDTKESTEELGIGEKITDAFSSFEGFFKALGKELDLAGDELDEFAEGMAVFAQTIYSSLREANDLQIKEQQRKLDAIQNSIDATQDAVDREKELYEQGYANNYEARQQDLENLKAQKREEEKELQRALKKKAAMQKAEFLVQTAMQFGDLVTASAKLFSSSVSLFGPFGVPVAMAAITTMFAAFALAKVKAFQAIGNVPTYRTGLKKGRLSLDGPSHEESGFGLFNSKTGKKVAEFEGGEDVLVFNKSQKRNYSHILDAMIADARGGLSLETSLRNHYNFPKTGQHTLQVVERVNTIMLKSQDAKAVASKENNVLFKEIVKIRERLDNEFEGYKREREEEVKSWETPEYFHVKKGPLTKNYPKKKGE